MAGKGRGSGPQGPGLSCAAGKKKKKGEEQVPAKKVAANRCTSARLAGEREKRGKKAKPRTRVTEAGGVL